MVVFSDYIVARYQSSGEKTSLDNLNRQIQRTDPGGGTDMYLALSTAIDILKEYDLSEYSPAIIVLEGLLAKGIVNQVDGTYYADMVRLADLIEQRTPWSDLGIQLYGNVKVHMTNPTMSNSGNMFAGLMANALNGGQVVSEETISEVLPRL